MHQIKKNKKQLQRGEGLFNFTDLVVRSQKYVQKSTQTKGGFVLENHYNKIRSPHRNLMKAASGLCAIACMVSAPAMAGDYSFSGQSDTILRMRTSIDKKDIYPIYDYLNFAMTSNRSDGSGVDFYLGAWGRVDLGEQWNGRNNDGDLQYAYLSYRAAKNNTVVNLGRQFVTEGVAAEKLDGAYIRSDFMAGIGIAAFAGKTVIADMEKGKNYGDIVYGGRLSQSMKQYYTVGMSALKSNTENGTSYREEFGSDLWVHPMKQLDLVGRSSYNNITEGWMEHAYTLSVTPIEQLRFSADITNVHYRDYLYNMTTPVFSFTFLNPNEVLTSYGGGISYSPIKHLTISGDFKYYDYEIAKEAKYFGGKATYSLPASLNLGCSVHRMDGNIDKLRYTEYRAFASKKLGHTDLAIDLTNSEYDAPINGIRNSYSVTGSAGYEISERLKVGADVEYAKNPDFDSEVRGLLKLSYMFDTNHKKGGAKSEK